MVLTQRVHMSVRSQRILRSRRRAVAVMRIQEVAFPPTAHHGARSVRPRRRPCP